MHDLMQLKIDSGYLINEINKQETENVLFFFIKGCGRNLKAYARLQQHENTTLLSYCLLPQWGGRKRVMVVRNTIITNTYMLPSSHEKHGKLFLKHTETCNMQKSLSDWKITCLSTTHEICALRMRATLQIKPNDLVAKMKLFPFVWDSEKRAKELGLSENRSIFECIWKL